MHNHEPVGCHSHMTHFANGNFADGAQRNGRTKTVKYCRECDNMPVVLPLASFAGRAYGLCFILLRATHAHHHHWQDGQKLRASAADCGKSLFELRRGSRPCQHRCAAAVWPQPFGPSSRAPDPTFTSATHCLSLYRMRQQGSKTDVGLSSLKRHPVPISRDAATLQGNMHTNTKLPAHTGGKAGAGLQPRGALLRITFSKSAAVITHGLTCRTSAWSQPGGWSFGVS